MLARGLYIGIQKLLMFIPNEHENAHPTHMIIPNYLVHLAGGGGMQTTSPDSQAPEDLVIRAASKCHTIPKE